MKIKSTQNRPRSRFLLATGLLLCACMLHGRLLAQDSGSVTVSQKQTTIRVVLDRIEQTTDYRFFYNDDAINASTKVVSIEAKDRSIESVLDELLKGTGISYQIVKNQVILSSKAAAATQGEAKGGTNAAPAGSVRISGVVTQSDGSPMSGVTIVERGASNNGTVTGTDGSYALTVKTGATLDVTFAGYAHKTVAVGSSPRINISMEENVISIGEVVAIGYGSQRKEDLSMAVSTIKVDDIAKGRPSDLATVLQGRIPGVTIQKVGDPAKEASYTIRGRGAKGADDSPNGANGVLFVVDGVPGAPFSVEDIETVTVLKDAASASIYGAAVGSGGVVLITTKQASAKTRVDVNVSMGFQSVAKLPSMITAENYNLAWKTAVENSANGQLPMAADPAQFPWGNTTRTDWLDEIFNNAQTEHYAITVSGGNEKIRSLLSASYDNAEGVLLNTYKRTLGAKFVTDIQLYKWLKVSERVSFENTNAQGNVDTGHEGPIMGAVWYPRSASVYEMNEDGTYALDAEGKKFFGGTSPLWSPASGYPNIFNPVAVLDRMRRLYPSSKLYSTTSLEIKPMRQLTIHSDFTADGHIFQADEFYPVMKEPGLQRSENLREWFRYQNTQWLWETTASYSQVFAGKHSVSAMGGYTMEYNKYYREGIYTRNYAHETGHAMLLDLNGGIDRLTSGIDEYSKMSVIGRVAYSYDDRYFLLGSIRRDASSKLPPERNYEVFPAVSGSWKLSSEPFFRSLNLGKYVNLIKFRGSWGVVGDDSAFDTHGYEVLATNHDRKIILGKGLDQEILGSYYRTIANHNLRWESTEQTGFGLDLLLLNRSLDISIDYYHKTTSRLMETIPLPMHGGVPENPMGNVGEVLNKGWEFALNYNGNLKNFTYNIWGNLSTNNGKVTDLGPRVAPLENGAILLNSRRLLYSLAGNPWYSFRVYKPSGIFQSQEDINNYVYKDSKTGESKLIQPNAKPGDLKYIDINKDGQITDADRVFNGSYQPKVTYSFGTTLGFKGFDFSIMMHGVWGNKVYNGMKQMASDGRQQGGNLIQDVMNSYDFGGNYPRLGLIEDTNGNYQNISDFFLEDGSFLRIKNLTLGYTLPATLLRKIGLEGSNLRFYMSVDNLATFTSYSGIDPETGNFGVDRGVYPVTRVMNFGLNMNF